MTVTRPARWAIAGAYRWLRHHNLRRSQEFQVLYRWLDPRPGERILDIGCGDGLYDFEIARADAQVVGIDINEARLERARRWHSGLSASYLSMNAAEMTFEDSSFDKAVSFCVIEHFKNDNEVLSQIHRVLKPGAPFLFSADSLTNTGLSQEERERHKERYSVNCFYDVDVIKQKLADAGFQLETTRYIMSSPLTLALVRLSWWLDRLPSHHFWLSGPGYLAMGTVGAQLASLSEEIWDRHDQGLTLIVLARKS